MKKVMNYLLLLIVFTSGFIIGGIIFRSSKPQTPFQISTVRNLMKPSEISGLITSVILQNIPEIIPNVILETDKTIIVKHPFPEHAIHYLAMPKKDIRNILELTEKDKEYIFDLLAAVNKVIYKENIRYYKLMTNGPDRQHLAYLHFHIISDYK